MTQVGFHAGAIDRLGLLKHQGFIAGAYGCGAVRGTV
jgi:hypothetical protein